MNYKLRAKQLIAALLVLIPCETSLAQKSISLEKSFEQAVQFHESLPMAEQDIQKAKAQYTQVLGGVTPRISAGFTEQLQEKVSTPGGGATANFTRFSTPQTYIGLTQPLFHGLIELYGLKYNRSLQEQLTAQKKEALRLLFIDVASAYYNAASVERSIQTIQTVLNIMDQQTHEYKHWLDLGKIRQSQSVRLDAEIAILRADLENLKGNRIVAYEILEFLTGLHPHPPVNLSNPMQQKIQPLEHYLDMAKSRPDVLVAKHNVQMQDYNKKMAVGALYPSADVAANLYPYRAGIQQNINWDVRFVVDVPVLNLTNFGKIKESKSELTKSKLALSLKQRTAENHIKTSYITLQSSVKEFQRYSHAADLTYKSYSLHRSDLDHGLVNQFEVLEAQKTWLNSLLSRDRAEVQVWQNVVSLIAASGVLP